MIPKISLGTLKIVSRSGVSSISLSNIKDSKQLLRYVEEAMEYEY